RTFCRISSTSSLWKGGLPVSSSYRMAPSAYTSAAVVSAEVEAPACSGAMYAGVPTMAPVRVRWASPTNRLARPKSLSSGSPASSQHLQHLVARDAQRPRPPGSRRGGRRRRCRPRRGVLVGLLHRVTKSVDDQVGLPLELLRRRIARGAAVQVSLDRARHVLGQ